jgi:hypothetical protein
MQIKRNHYTPPDATELTKFVSPASDMTSKIWADFAKDNNNLRLMFCNRKLMRTDIFSLGSPNPYATS